METREDITKIDQISLEIFLLINEVGLLVKNLNPIPIIILN